MRNVLPGVAVHAMQGGKHYEIELQQVRGSRDSRGGKRSRCYTAADYYALLYCVPVSVSGSIDRMKQSISF